MPQYNEDVKAKVSRLAQIDATIKTLEGQRKAIVDEIISEGYRGCNIPSTSGDQVLNLSSGEGSAIDTDKAKSLYGADYDAVLKDKQSKVEVTITDMRNSKRLSSSQLAEITIKVAATVRATIRRP